MKDSGHVADLFQVFADPTRLRVLNLLLHEKELCVCDLSVALEETQPKVSRHLAILRKSGLVSVRDEGKWKFYALGRDRSRLQQNLVRTIRAMVDETSDFHADRARLDGLALQLRCR